MASRLCLQITSPLTITTIKVECASRNACLLWKNPKGFSQEKKVKI